METNEMNMAEDPSGGPLGDGGAPDYQIAGVGQRIGGFIIDAVIASIVGNIIGFGLGAISESLFFVGSLISLAYLLLRDALPFTDGQSIGKKVLNIRAVEVDTLEPLTNNWAKSAIRSVSAILPILRLIDLIFIFNEDNQRQRLGDKWADTIVIED